ncbi:hypothetical protein BS653_25880 (plasmid) [Shigella flexneri 4c]|nr:hypothetical protein BS653_25880 [Shigella flexneri 4c]
MTEQENKIPTATEIEQQLRERRQKELEQAGKTPEEEPGKPALQLGIEKLKKSRKGMIILVVGFLLLAAVFLFIISRPLSVLCRQGMRNPQVSRLQPERLNVRPD